MTTSTATASTTKTQKGCSVDDSGLIVATFAIALVHGGFAAQVVLDSRFVNGASKQPIVVSPRWSFRSLELSPVKGSRARDNQPT